MWRSSLCDQGVEKEAEYVPRNKHRRKEFLKPLFFQMIPNFKEFNVNADLALIFTN